MTEHIESAVVADIGGTEVKLGAMVQGELVEHVLFDTPRDPDQLFADLGGRIVRFARKYDASVANINVPGAVRRTTKGAVIDPFPDVAMLNTTFDVRERLIDNERRLKGMGILTSNDAAAAAHAVGRLPELRGGQAGRTTYITQSLGVGGDTIQDGKVSSEQPDGWLGEYGHVVLKTAYGHYSTLERQISGNAIRRLYGRGVTPACAIARDPSPWASFVWERVGHDFAQGLVGMVALVGMDNIVIGGGVSRARERYDAILRGEFTKALQHLPPGLMQEPHIHYLPKDLIHTITLRGGYYALQQRADEIVY